MKMVEIKAIAKQRGIKSGKMKKADLVRTIQTAEGNNPCFLTGVVDCDQLKCSWRIDCQTD